jgi:hypothetical protein
MTDLTFQNPDEARAWDMYVAAGVINHMNVSAVHALRADDLILERRKRMAPEKLGREWIPHIPGDPMPCDGEMLVDIKIQGGASYADQAAIETDWSDCFRPVTAWRPA